MTQKPVLTELGECPVLRMLFGLNREIREAEAAHPIDYARIHGLRALKARLIDTIGVSEK